MKLKNKYNSGKPQTLTELFKLELENKTFNIVQKHELQEENLDPKCAAIIQENFYQSLSKHK